jgi:hypothetical protein
MICSACGRSIQCDQLRCEACGHDMLPEDIARHLPAVPTAAVLESEFLGVVLEAKERLATNVPAVPVFPHEARLVLPGLEAKERLATSVPAIPVFQHEARLVLASEAIRRAGWRLFPLLAALFVLATRPMREAPTVADLESRQDAARLALASEAMRRARWRVFAILAALIALATLFLLAGR